MEKRLREIADIRVGYQFRGKVEPDPAGNVRVIQIKDLDPDRRIRLNDLATVRVDRPEPHLARQGDLLFLARGHRQFATVIAEPVTDTIVTGFFFVVRPTTGKLYPEYLAWWINGREFQEALRPFVRGSHMPLVSKADFQEMRVAVPSPAVQGLIVRLHEQQETERRLVRELLEKRTALIEAVSRRAARRRKG
jgi:hypothetical protein